MLGFGLVLAVCIVNRRLKTCFPYLELISEAQGCDKGIFYCRCGIWSGLSTADDLPSGTWLYGLMVGSRVGRLEKKKSIDIVEDRVTSPTVLSR